MLGKVVGGKYQIIEKLGSGGSGQVYKAYHVHLKSTWALKIISSDEEFALNELKVLKNVNHPVFPRLVDVIKENGSNTLVFDFYEGSSLEKILNTYGRIDEKRVYKWAIQILDALSYLHSNSPEPIIYRDLKPSNLIVLKDDSIKLIDFGTARQFKENSSEDTVYLGTPGYAAPEQYGSGQTDVRTDIYNFGMTIFHLLTGVHPLKCNEVQAKLLLQDAGISKDFSSMVLKCIHRDPDERFVSVEEIRKTINLSMNNAVSAKYQAIGKNAVEISVSGTQKGVGVTHFCMLFGMWLKYKGFKTAVLEYYEKGDSLDLCKILNKESQFKKNGYYQIKGLSIYPSMGIEKIGNFKRAEYDYILIDYGIHDEYISQLMPRSDVRLIIAPGADWKIRSVDIFINKYEKILKHPNTYLSFPMQDKKSINVIKSYFKKINIIAIPYTVNPWKINSLVNKEIENIFQNLFQIKVNVARRR